MRACFQHGISTFCSLDSCLGPCLTKTDQVNYQHSNQACPESSQSGYENWINERTGNFVAGKERKWTIIAFNTRPPCGGTCNSCSSLKDYVSQPFPVLTTEVFHSLHDQIWILSLSSTFTHDILALACLLLEQTFAVQETC